MKTRIILIFTLICLLLSSCNLPGGQAAPPTVTPGNVSTPPAETNSPASFESITAITILRPMEGETYPVNSPIPILFVYTGSDALAQVELLDNGISAGVMSGEDIPPRLDWSPQTPGPHTLELRASTSTGQMLASGALHVEVDAAPVGFDAVRTTLAGDTLASLAAQFGSSPALILTNNPGLGSAAENDPLPVGLSLRIPIRPPAAPQSLAASQGSAIIPAFSAPASPNFDFAQTPSFDKVYLYLSLDGSPWSRVPRLADDFISPPNGFFNLDESLKGIVAPPAQGNTHVKIDAWGWSGGTLVYIGRFERIYSAEGGQEPFVILPGKLEICDGSDCKNGFGQFTESATSNGGKRELRWTPPGGVSAGIWQVARMPFDGTCNPNPTTVFLSGKLNTSSILTTFDVAFPLAGQDKFSINVPQPGGGLSILLNGGAFPQRYFARVLPIVNGQVQCSPSNTVTLDVTNPAEFSVDAPPAAPTPPVLYDVEITDVTPIHFPKYDDMYCVIVVENPYYQNQSDFEDGWLGSVYKNIAPGTKLCPQKYVYEEPSFLEKAGEFLKDALNTISMVYAAIKELAIKLVAKAIPLCLASEFVDSYKDEIDSVCNAAAEVIVDAAMAYVGLPPSIPNYEQLKNTAKGQVVDLAVEQLEAQTGLPCVEACRDFISDRVDDIWTATEELLSGPQGCMDSFDAHNKGIEPLCLPPTIKVVPPPETLLQPATVSVRLTRRSDAPDSALPDPALYKTSCRLEIGSEAKNDSYVGQQVFIGQDYTSGKLLYWTGTSISGYPFQSISASVNGLAPGESKDFSFALQPQQGSFPPASNSGFWLPGRLELYKNYWYNSGQSAYWHANDDWEYLYLGAQLTLTAQANCTTSGENLTPASSSASDTWTEQIPNDK